MGKMLKLINRQIKAIALGAAMFSLTAGGAIITPLAANEIKAGFELPKDVVNSVMWTDIARDYLLKDKASSGKIVMDERVLVHTPKIAEDQMNIPVHVDARTVENVQKIILIADLNPLPKILTYLPKNADARLSVRIKVEQGTPVRAAVLDGAGVWHVGATYVDASGGGCSQPALAHSSDDWVKTLAEVRARVWRDESDGTATMRLTIKHPMDTGLADGIPAFFIEKLDLNAPDGTALGQLYLHEPVSENPTITLFPKLNASITNVIVKGRDNEGNLIKVKVPAPYRSSALQ